MHGSLKLEDGSLRLEHGSLTLEHDGQMGLGRGHTSGAPLDKPSWTTSQAQAQAFLSLRWRAFANVHERFVAEQRRSQANDATTASSEVA